MANLEQEVLGAPLSELNGRTIDPNWEPTPTANNIIKIDYTNKTGGQMPDFSNGTTQEISKDLTESSRNYLQTFDKLTQSLKETQDLYDSSKEYNKTLSGKKREKHLQEIKNEFESQIALAKENLKLNQQNMEDSFFNKIDEKLGIDPELSSYNARNQAPLTSEQKFNGEISIAEKRAQALTEKMGKLNSVQKLDIEAIQEVARKAAEATGEKDAFASIINLEPKLNPEIVEREAATAAQATENATKNAAKEGSESALKSAKSFFGKHGGKVAGLLALGGMVFAMNSSRGHQENSQLYGQAPAYQQQ